VVTVRYHMMMSVKFQKIC